MKYLKLFFALALLAFFQNAFTQEDAPQTVFQSLSSEDALNITIKTNLKKLIKLKTEEEYQESTLTYTQDGQEVNWTVEVRARGNLRQRVCYLPPLKIKFPKEEVVAKGWKSFRNLKMVSFCKTSASFQDLVLKEYYIYKMYNELTDNSFKVQLINVNFIDSEGKMKPLESFGFFIEPDKELAERLNCRLVDVKRGSPTRLQAEAFDLFTVFQFMIGNTDWSVYNMHNLKQIYSEDHQYPIPVPYDFDHSGLVNAPYAVPHESMPIESVRERLFMGNCREAGKYDAVFELFKSKKETFFELLENDTMLSNGSKKLALRYLTDFYTILDNPKKTKKLIVDDCDKFVVK